MVFHVHAAYYAVPFLGDLFFGVVNHERRFLGVPQGPSIAAVLPGSRWSGRA